MDLPAVCLVAEGVQQPGPGRAGVGQGLDGGEGLGADDEQGLGRVQVAGLLGDVGPVDVGHEPEGPRPVAVGP